MTDNIMLALIWAAAGYRIYFSIRHRRTIWRTAFTTCTLCVAAGAILGYYGAQAIDSSLGIWNLTPLLSQLLLLVAAGATLIYVVTLQQPNVPQRLIRLWLYATAATMTVVTVSWLAAPIHDGPYPDLTLLVQHTSVAVFKGVYYSYLMLAMVAAARICLLRGIDRHDLVRSISMTFSGIGCTLGVAAFATGTVVVVARRFMGANLISVMRVAEQASSLALIIASLGILTLAVAPGLVALTHNYSQWLCLRPLWQEMIRLCPEVHLGRPIRGTPSRRLQLRVQRALVEIRDALRLIQVPLEPRAGVTALGQALGARRLGEGRAAAEVLERVTTREDDIGQVLALARTYVEARQ